MEQNTKTIIGVCCVFFIFLMFGCLIGIDYEHDRAEQISEIKCYTIKNSSYYAWEQTWNIFSRRAGRRHNWDEYTGKTFASKDDAKYFLIHNNASICE